MDTIDIHMDRVLTSQSILKALEHLVSIFPLYITQCRYRYVQIGTASYAFLSQCCQASKRCPSIDMSELTVVRAKRVRHHLVLNVLCIQRENVQTEETRDVFLLRTHKWSNSDG